MEGWTGDAWTAGFSSDLPEDLQPGRLEETTEQLISDSCKYLKSPDWLKLMKQLMNFCKCELNTAGGGGVDQTFAVCGLCAVSAGPGSGSSPQPRTFPVRSPGATKPATNHLKPA